MPLMPCIKLNSVTDHRHILEPYGGPHSRHSCPECGGTKCFSRYIDQVTREYLADEVGRCNREDKCGYHYKPSQYFQDNGIAFETARPQRFRKGEGLRIQPQRDRTPSLVPHDLFLASIELGAGNLADFLLTLADRATVDALLKEYHVGSSRLFPGATIFWQVDARGGVRAGKIFTYDPETGKRRKDLNVSWVHKVAKLPDFNLVQCLFGEHLLKVHPRKRVAIVESEKTALIASLRFPDVIWLAAGGINGLSERACKCLRGRKVTLFPDLGAGFEKWSQKAEELAKIVPMAVSTFLQDRATAKECAEGLDLADFIVPELRAQWGQLVPQVPLMPGSRTTKASQSDQPAPQPQLISETPVLRAQFIAAVNAEASGTSEESSAMACERLGIPYSTALQILDDYATELGYSLEAVIEEPNEAETILPPLDPQTELLSSSVAELETWLGMRGVISGPVTLYPHLRIESPEKFICGHLEMARAHEGNAVFQPYLDRLVAFRGALLAIELPPSGTVKYKGSL